MSNRGLIVSNVLWKLGEKIGIQLVSTIVSIVVARFVEPAAFGTIAIANALIALLEIIVDGGLGNALIQKKNPDSLDFSTIFYSNLVICIVCYVFLYCFAPYVANFYSNEELISIIRVLGISIIIYGLKDVQHAYIAKQMQFKKFFFASLAGTIVSGVVGIVMAINNYGVWSLVATNLVDLFIDTIIIWISIKWRPTLQFSFERLRKSLNYSSKLLINSILGVFYNKFYQFSIGKYYSVSDLAYYDKGESLPTKLIGNLTGSLCSVIKPVLSNNQDNNDTIKQIAKSTIKISTYIMIPMLFGLSMIATPLITLLYTEKWLPMVIYIQITCICQFFINIININGEILRAKGKSDLILKYCTIIEIIGIILLFVSIKYGVIALAISKIVVYVIELFIFTSGSNNLVGYSIFEQIKDITINIILGLIMCIPVYLVSLLNINSVIVLLLQILSGIITYIGLSYIFKVDSFCIAIESVKELYQKR